MPRFFRCPVGGRSGSVGVLSRRHVLHFLPAAPLGQLVQRGNFGLVRGQAPAELGRQPVGGVGAVGVRQRRQPLGGVLIGLGAVALGGDRDKAAFGIQVVGSPSR